MALDMKNILKEFSNDLKKEREERKKLESSVAYQNQLIIDKEWALLEEKEKEKEEIESLIDEWKKKVIEGGYGAMRSQLLLTYMNYKKIFSKWWENLKEQHKSIRLLAAFGTKIKESWNSLVSTVSGHITDVLGSEITGLIKGVYEGLKNTTKHIYTFFKGDKESKGDKKRNKLLEKTKEYMKGLWLHFKGEKLASLRKFDEKKPVKMLLFILGLMLGMVAGFAVTWSKVLKSTILKPFILIGKALGKILTPLGRLLKLKFPKITGFVGKFFGQFGRLAKWFKTSGSMFAKAFRLGKGIGSKFLFPLFAIIDFFIGFFKTEGGLKEKIISGLQNVIRGIFEMPLRLIGWITDKILKLFGVEIKGGVGKKLVEGMEWVIDLFGKYLKAVFAFWKFVAGIFMGFFKGKGIEKLKEGFSKIKEVFEDFWKGFRKAFGWIPVIFKKIVDFFKSKQKKIEEDKKATEEGVAVIDQVTTKNKEELAAEAKKKKEELKPEEENKMAQFEQVNVKLLQVAEMTGAIKREEKEETRKNQREIGEKLGSIQQGTMEQNNIMSQNNQESKSDSSGQIPDTVELSGLALGNMLG